MDNHRNYLPLRFTVAPADRFCLMVLCWGPLFTAISTARSNRAHASGRISMVGFFVVPFFAITK